MKTGYKSNFEKFLSHTDEKEILLEEITKDIDKNKVVSLLDIGAGNGLLSIPLSKKVEYTAVEGLDKFTEKLKGAGLKVVQGKFPLDVDGTFDMVLVSHALSYEQGEYEKFIEKAWELLNPGGVLLIITYRGQKDEWTDFMHELGEQQAEDHNRSGFNKIIEFLYSLGEVKTRKVTTKVRTDTIEDMIQALSFVASDGIEELKERFVQQSSKIEKILESKYKDDRGYFFPFQHFFISVHKK